MEVPAEFAVTRMVPGGGTQTIYACPAHLARTKAVLQQHGGTVTAGPANRHADGSQLDTPVHGCKGCLDGWPGGQRPGGRMPLIVQTAHAAGTSVSFGAGTSGGSCVTAALGDIGFVNTPAVTAVTLGGSADNFAVLATATGTSHQMVTIWADPSCASAQTAVAVTETNSGHPSVIAYEISGIAATSPLDQSSTGAASSGTSWSSGTTGTTAQAAQAWIGAAVLPATPTGPSSPWANTTQANSSDQVIAGQQITASTGTATYSGTSAGAVWAAVVVTLKPGTIPVSGGDTGAAADTATIAVTSSDAGSGTETGAVAAAVPGADTGTGTEATASIAVTSADTGSGADTGTATQGTSGSDAGTGTEAGSIAAAVPGGDTAAGAEPGAITARTSSSDTAAGAEAGSVTLLIPVGSPDAGSAAESASVKVKPAVLWRAPGRLSRKGGTMT